MSDIEVVTYGSGDDGIVNSVTRSYDDGTGMATATVAQNGEDIFKVSIRASDAGALQASDVIGLAMMTEQASGGNNDGFITGLNTGFSESFGGTAVDHIRGLAESVFDDYTDE